MVQARLQIVDSIGPDPEILLDLNNGGPFFIMENSWSAEPPALTRSTSRSTLRDGETVSGSSYSDRVIEVRVGVNVEDDEDAAAAIQVLARLLDRNSSWLRWHAGNMARPVFFRAKRAEITEYDEYNGTTAFKVAALRIPADPFAYGEKVEGSFSVSNASFVHEWSDTVQGDVATPLCLSFHHPAELKEFVTVAASVARLDEPQSAAFVKSLAASGAPPAASGWTVTDSADTTTLGGNKRRLVRAVAGVESFQGATPAVLAWADLPPGEYRVFVRARLIAGTNVSLLFAGGTAGVAGHTYPTIQLPIRNAPGTGAGWDWYDMGDVVSLPAGNPRPDDVFSAAPAVSVSTYWTLSAVSASVTTIDLDSVLLVPVGGANVASSRMSMSRGPATLAAKDVVLDGVTDRRWFDQAGLLGYFSAIAGELPVLVPGAFNTLHLMLAAAVNASGTYTGRADDKTAVTTVSYAYFPRYTSGFRPAAS